MKKGLVIVTVIVIAIILIIIVWLASRPAPVPAVPTVETPEVLGGDTTSAINEQLDSLDLGDLNTEFEQIDAELNQL